jgi:hypothetical protein
MPSAPPIVDYVIACEAVRPEIGHKLGILGFYGVLPRAHIRLLKWGAPTTLVFLVNTHGGSGQFKIQLKIKQPDSSELVPAVELQTDPSIDGDTNAMIVFQFPIIAFRQPGKHRVEVRINNKSVYEQPFLVGEGLLDLPAPK